jgi:hypothetical protein
MAADEVFDMEPAPASTGVANPKTASDPTAGDSVNTEQNPQTIDVAIRAMIDKHMPAVEAGGVEADQRIRAFLHDFASLF